MSKPEQSDFERELAVYEFLLGYGTMLAEGIDAARFCEQPLPNVNHPAWQFGHLTVVAQRICARLHAGPGPDDNWVKLFSGGSAPSSDASRYPGKEELVRAWTEQHGRVVQAVRSAKPEVLASPNPVERMRPQLPTMAHLVTALLTMHEAQHLGQLSMWRRAVGIPALF